MCVFIMQRDGERDIGRAGVFESQKVRKGGTVRAAGRGVHTEETSPSLTLLYQHWIRFYYLTHYHFQQP